MNPNTILANGTRTIFYDRGQPEPSSFNMTESSVSIFSTLLDYPELLDNLSEPEESNPALCDGPCLCGRQCHIFQSLPFFLEDSIPYDENFFPPADTERDHGSSPSMVSPVSTYSGPTMPSSPEDAEALNAVEGAKSANDNNSGNCINVSIPENSVLPAELSKPGCSRTCTGCVRHASAYHDGHRLTASEVEIRRRNFFKGVNKKKNSDKWTCEIRISKKLLEDSELKAKGKLWLGTFDTHCQAARALHVGRFLLSEKKKNSTTDRNFEQRSETILSDFKDLMRGKPIDAELLSRVKKLATEYGKNGSL